MTEQKTAAELRLIAVDNDAMAIRDFSPEQITKEVCQRAWIKAKDMRVLFYIPFEDIHERVLKYHCSNFMEIKTFLDNMNPIYITPKLAGMICAEDMNFFYFLPAHAKDRELCEKAVGYNGSFLQYVPEEFKTTDLCMTAIQHSPYAIPYIPEKMKDQELYARLVQENSLNLRGIPKEERTPELCQIAFENTYGKNKDDYSIIEAITVPEMILQILQEQNDPQKIYSLINAIQLNRDVITEEIALEAVHKNGAVLRFLSEKVITPQVVEGAFENCLYSAQWVPTHMQTPGMYLYMEKEMKNVPVHIPDEVLKGDNIYTFARKVEEKTDLTLSYNTHKLLYGGRTIHVRNVRTETGIIPMCKLSYDLFSRSLKLREISPQQSEKQNRSTRPKR